MKNITIIFSIIFIGSLSSFAGFDDLLKRAESGDPKEILELSKNVSSGRSLPKKWPDNMVNLLGKWGYQVESSPEDLTQFRNEILFYLIVKSAHADAAWAFHSLASRIALGRMPTTWQVSVKSLLQDIQVGWSENTEDVLKQAVFAFWVKADQGGLGKASGLLVANIIKGWRPVNWLKLVAPVLNNGQVKFSEDREEYQRQAAFYLLAKAAQADKKVNFGDLFPKFLKLGGLPSNWLEILRSFTIVTDFGNGTFAFTFGPLFSSTTYTIDINRFQ